MKEEMEKFNQKIKDLNFYYQNYLIATKAWDSVRKRTENYIWDKIKELWLERFPGTRLVSIGGYHDRDENISFRVGSLDGGCHTDNWEPSLISMFEGVEKDGISFFPSVEGEWISDYTETEIKKIPGTEITALDFINFLKEIKENLFVYFDFEESFLNYRKINSIYEDEEK